MINNNNRKTGLYIFHAICGIIYLVCVPLSIYGYYAYATSYSSYGLYYSSVDYDYTWLIVSLILDFIVIVLSIVECAISCCNCCGWYQTPQAPVVMMYPPNGNYTSAHPAGLVQDSSKRDWFPPNGEKT